jgi:fatty acid/phospholipid biosynthesis enzyme
VPDLFQGVADVVVCDGASGHLTLKVCQDVMNFGRHVHEQGSAQQPLAAAYQTWNTGVRPLLGTDGICLGYPAEAGATGAKDALVLAAAWLSAELNDRIVRELEAGPLD